MFKRGGHQNFVFFCLGAETMQWHKIPGNLLDFFSTGKIENPEGASSDVVAVSKILCNYVQPISVLYHMSPKM